MVFMQVGTYLFGTEFAADKGVDVLNYLRIEFIGFSPVLFGQPALLLCFFGAVLLSLDAVPLDFAADGAFVAVELFGDFGDGAVAGQVLDMVPFVLGQLCVAHGNLSCRKGRMLPHTGLFLLWKVALQMRIRRPMNVPLLLTAALAFLSGALITWLLARNKAQTQQFALMQSLTECRQHLEFAEQNQAQTASELADARYHVQDLQGELQELGNRFAAAERQIGYLQEREQEAGRLKQDYAELQENAHNLHVRNERLHIQLEQERLAADEKLKLLAEARQSLGDQFQNLANTILEEKSRRFTEQNRDHLSQLLTPLNERIHGFSELVQQTYEKEARERLTLENELKRLQTLNTQLHSDAKALTDALTGTQNKTQGNWGEMILESVLEHSGLQKGREYTVQAAAVRQEEDGARRLQPDVLVNLPEGKQIVIDSKVSLTAYVRYTQAADAETAERELAAHVASIRAHIRSLSQKDYTDLEGVRTLDFVFMFIPVEPAYLLALQHDAALFQECFDKRIMPVGPSTLLATLRTVAHIWRNEQQNQNALAIAAEGGRLYDKFTGFIQTLESVGKNIDQAQSQFQQAYKQLSQGRGNLISRAEKLRALGVKTTKRLQRDLVENAQESSLQDKGLLEGEED